MNKFKGSLFLSSTLILIGACSSNKPPELKQVHYLLTQESSEQYFYCESCNEPTVLTKQIYKPLEPDAPIESVPVITQPTHIERMVNHKRTVKHKHRYKKLKLKLTKQCIQWRTIKNEKE